MNKKPFRYGQKLPISATIICFNEEANIEPTLKSLHFVDEIVVVDSYSADKTIEIVSKYTSKIYYRKFTDFSSQRNYALSKVSNQWVMRIDADEIIPEDLVHKIYDLVNTDNPDIKTIYKVPRKVYFMGREIRYSHWGNEYIHLLFNFNNFKYKNTVHETPDIQEVRRIEVHEAHFLHNTYKGIQSMIQKTNHYSTIRAYTMFQKKKKITFFHFFIKPVHRFLFHYVFHFGFLDGRQGFVIAKMKALEVYWRYLKCWRLQNNEDINL